MVVDKYILWYTHLRYWVLTTTNKKVIKTKTVVTDDSLAQSWLVLASLDQSWSVLISLDRSWSVLAQCVDRIINLFTLVTSPKSDSFFYVFKLN